MSNEITREELIEFVCQRLKRQHVEVDIEHIREFFEHVPEHEITDCLDALNKVGLSLGYIDHVMSMYDNKSMN